MHGLNIIVCTSYTAGSRYAHMINTVKMAEGFAKLGNTVTMICLSPRERKLSDDELARQYALNAPITWMQFPMFSERQYGDYHPGIVIQALPYLLSRKIDFAYIRNHFFPWVIPRLGIPTATELHDVPDSNNSAFKALMKLTRHKEFQTLSTISNVLRDGYIERGVPAEKILVLPDSVDLVTFTPPVHLPQSPYSGGPNIVYSGHLYDYKGIPTILETAGLMPEIVFHLVGGRENDMARVAQTVADMGLKNVILHGWKPLTEVPNYLWHADILLLTPSANHKSATSTSPVKLGEYLASGRPIISSAIPALKDWLTDKETHFVEPDNPKALADGIRFLLKSDTEMMIQNARQMAQTLSYEGRAEKILKHTLG